MGDPGGSLTFRFSQFRANLKSMADFYEEFKVHSRELVEKVKDLIHEGSVRRIIIRDEKGHTFLEIPVTIAAIGVIAAPVAAAVGAVAAVVAKFTVIVQRVEDPGSGPAPHPSGQAGSPPVS